MNTMGSSIVYVNTNTTANTGSGLIYKNVSDWSMPFVNRTASGGTLTLNKMATLVSAIRDPIKRNIVQLVLRIKVKRR